jgi:hypothetical protein
MLDVELQSHANGRTHGTMLRTRTTGAGIAAQKSTGNQIAQQRAAEERLQSLVTLAAQGRWWWWIQPNSYKKCDLYDNSNQGGYPKDQ